MEVSHKNDVLASSAAKRLGQFVRQRRQQWDTKGFAPDFETFERELHEYMPEAGLRLHSGSQILKYCFS